MFITLKEIKNLSEYIVEHYFTDSKLTEATNYIELEVIGDSFWKNWKPVTLELLKKNPEISFKPFYKVNIFSSDGYLEIIFKFYYNNEIGGIIHFEANFIVDICLT